MSHFIPLHQLLATGRPHDHPVGFDDQQVVTWKTFHDRVARYAAIFLKSTATRWLLISQEPLTFAAQLMGLLHAHKVAIIPANVQPGTLRLLQADIDAVVDFEPGDEISELRKLDPTLQSMVLFTSGSTGKPKAITKSLAQFEAEMQVLEKQFGRLIEDCGFFGTAPHHHLYGLTFRIFWPLSSGRPTDNQTCTQPHMMLARLAVVGEGVMVSSPSQLSRWPELLSLRGMTQRPRMILSAGGPLTKKTSNTWQLEMGRAPTEIFGSSETGVIAWRRQDQSHLWQAFAGIHVQADASQALLVTSPLLGSLQTLSMEDVVEILPDQRFVLKGRLDRTIKLEEKRLFLPDMENRLIDHPAVDDAVLVLLTGTRQTLGAVVLLSKEGRQQLQSLGRRDFIQSLKKHLVLHFEQVLIPKRWRFPQALPFNERGKLAADAIQSLFAHENR